MSPGRGERILRRSAAQLTVIVNHGRWGLLLNAWSGQTPRLGQGGVDATSRKMQRSLLVRSGRGGSFNYRLIGNLNQPSLDGCALSGLRASPARLREFRLLRDIFLIAQPPLLSQGGEFPLFTIVPGLSNSPLQPWLRSAAATRLNKDAAAPQ